MPNVASLARIFRRQKPKVFCIGFNKTGTSSLHHLFEEMGYRSYHGERWRNVKHNPLLRAYDCFSDGIPSDFRWLDRAYPGSKYILQVRDLDRWVVSRLGHIQREKEQGTYRESEYWSDDEKAIKTWVKQRNDYHISVMKHFMNRSDFLVVNFIRNEDSAENVARFLHKSGEFTRPKRNAAGAPKSIFLDMFNDIADQLKLTVEERSYDIHCPTLSGELGKLVPYDSSGKEFA